MRWRDVIEDSRQAVRSIVTSVRRHLDSAGDRWHPTSFNASNQVRVMLFRECDRRGRKLLFDSKTVHKCKNVSPSKTDVRRQSATSYVVENGVTYEYSKPSGDLKMLGEMIFGSVAMSFQGSTLKVHTIRSPPQLMVSLIFPAPSTSSISRPDFDGSGCFESSFSSECSATGHTSCVAHSVPMDVPGFCKNGSSSDLLDSLDQWSAESSLAHSSSYSSFQRRFMNSMSTSIEYGLGSRNDHNNSLTEDTPGGRKIKLGLGIVISFPEDDPDEEFMRFQDFFFSHVALMEGHVQRLSMTCQQSFAEKHSFVGSLMEGVAQLKGSLHAIYCSPRLPRPPAWLALVDPSAANRVHARSLGTQLLYLIKHFDTKNTHFFVSTLLTAVLSGHLSWVSTVAPGSTSPQKSYPCGQHYVRRESAQWLDSLAQTHPYNPLWVQLGDLYGAVGFPLKLCRTLVVGKNSELILRFLYVLSYFIRCSDVCDRLISQVTSADLSIATAPCHIKTKNMIPKTEKAKTVVFLLGDSPPESSPQPGPSNLNPVITNPQTDSSLGYDSLPEILENGDQEVCEQELDKTLKETCSQRDIKSSKLFLQEYNQLRFRDLSVESLTVKSSDCEDHEDHEEGYHSMEDCPVQSCGACSQYEALELDMPRVELEEKGFSKGLGVSLLGGVSSHYAPDLCLQGLLVSRGSSHFMDNVMQELITYSQVSILGEAQNVTILADTDTWQVHQVQSGPTSNVKTAVSMSPLVAGICDSLIQMEQLGMSTDFCLMHLEDRLQELYFRSMSVASFLSEKRTICPEKAAACLGLHCSDLPLLVAVASTTGPQT